LIRLIFLKTLKPDFVNVVCSRRDGDMSSNKVVPLMEEDPHELSHVPFSEKGSQSPGHDDGAVRQRIGVLLLGVGEDEDPGALSVRG